MFLEVKHSQNSLDILKKITEDFSQTNIPLREVKGICIVHMQPLQDTVSDNWNIYGFIDSYNCEIKIFDYKKKLFYVSQTLHDEIDIQVPCKLRVFKDLSTMLIIRFPVRIKYARTVVIDKIL